MLKKIAIAASVFSLCGCEITPIHIMPGMQNISTYRVHKQARKEKIQVQPTVVAITPGLIADKGMRVYDYRVSPSDVLHVNVWEHPEFALEAQNMTAAAAGVQGAAGLPGYLVDVHGRIFFPLIGYVKVAGKTLDQVRKDVTRKLEQYIPNPQVNVRIADYRGQRVYVLGEVMKKGFLPINDQQLTIADALALSGWIDAKYADPSNIFVIRGDYTRPMIYWLDARTPDKLLLAEHFSLQPKDVLYVSAAPIAQLNRVLDQLLPIVQTIWFTQSVVKQSENNS